MKVSLERKLIAYSVMATVGLIMVHATSVLLRKYLAPDAPPAAYQLVWGTLATMFAAALLPNGRWGLTIHYLLSLGLGSLALLVGGLIDGSLLVPMIAVPFVCPVVTTVAERTARQLPSWLDGSARRRPVRSILWVLLATLMVVQTARLSSWVTDPEQEWWITTDHPLFAGHLCMNAYIYAADLNRQGEENVYDAAHYPGLNPNAEVHTTIANFAPEDPYQYPPQFLLLPRLAIALSSDFDVIKIFWFALQALFFGFIAWTVARYIGGETGLIAALLIPLLWISFPVLSNLQYGQFHLMSIMLGTAGMIWFTQGRYHLGGASLAFAMLSKMAPGVLLIYLLARKRWKEAGWTIGYAVAFSILAFVVVGPKPFIAFFNYQIPHLQNGAAFAFHEIWPDFRDILIAGNISPYAFILKLDALGIPGMTARVASLTHLVYTLLVVVAAFLAARIKGTRYTNVLVWLALLNLATMVSKGAWGDYIPAGTLWILTLTVKDITNTVPQKILTGALWVVMFLSLGTLPLPGLTNPDLFISLAGFTMLVTIGFNLWVLYRQGRVEATVDRVEVEA